MLDSTYSLEYTLVNSNKRLKNTHYSPEIVVELYDREGKFCPIRALLDSGTTSTLILKRYVNRASPKAYKAPVKTTWLTRGGTFVTRSKRLLEFSFPEFSTDKTISWVCHVDDNTEYTSNLYDMIIGTDLMEELGISLKFDE